MPYRRLVVILLIALANRSLVAIASPVHLSLRVASIRITPSPGGLTYTLPRKTAKSLLAFLDDHVDAKDVYDYATSWGDNAGEFEFTLQIKAMLWLAANQEQRKNLKLDRVDDGRAKAR